MLFLTLTSVENKLPMIAIRKTDVRVLESIEREVYEDGEWKVAAISATLVTLFDGAKHKVAEPIADILKQLETI